tara:strand:- start:50 stop:472 length:423 start_codon:yes stop_codon:yes gene_type:complete
MWLQKEVTVKSKNRGFHLITNEVKNNIPELSSIKIGILHVFIKHSSASITINENSDKSVRLDFESHFNEMIPDYSKNYTHIYEGPDDMSAHIKSSILGNSLSIPIKNGELQLGVWQGIYLCEHRNGIRQRKLILTINGKN